MKATELIGKTVTRIAAPFLDYDIVKIVNADDEIIVVSQVGIEGAIRSLCSGGVLLGSEYNDDNWKDITALLEPPPKINSLTIFCDEGKSDQYDNVFRTCQLLGLRMEQH